MTDGKKASVLLIYLLSKGGEQSFLMSIVNFHDDSLCEMAYRLLPEGLRPGAEHEFCLAKRSYLGFIIPVFWS